MLFLEILSNSNPYPVFKEIFLSQKSEFLKKNQSCYLRSVVFMYTLYHFAQVNIIQICSFGSNTKSNQV